MRAYIMIYLVNLFLTWVGTKRRAIGILRVVSNVMYVVFHFQQIVLTAHYLSMTESARW